MNTQKILDYAEIEIKELMKKSRRFNIKEKIIDKPIDLHLYGISKCREVK